MYVTALSVQAHAVVDSLTPERRREFETIRDHLAAFLPALERAGLVRRTEFFNPEGWYRYYDPTFPYFIYFELGSTMFGFRMDVLLIALILPG